MKRATVTGLAVLAVLAVWSLWRFGRPGVESTAARAYQVEGVVIALENDGAVLVAHREIRGYMPAMTMPFTLADVRDRERLSPGDVVQFTFRVGADRSLASAFSVTGRDAATVEAFRAASARNAARVRPGDRLPAFSLVDQAGQPLTDSSLAGRPTALTFIFTRCPVPEYCPRISGQFREVQRAVQSDPALADARLLSVTLDPTHDTPPILEAYGRAMRADFARWWFATGTPDQVAALTQAFAVRSQPSAGTIDHTLATAVIDTTGHVAEIWRGNEWKVDDVLTALRRAGRAR